MLIHLITTATGTVIKWSGRPPFISASKSNMKSAPFHFFLFLLLSLGAFFLLCWPSYLELLDGNKCDMTYSPGPDYRRVLVKIQSTYRYKLWRYSVNRTNKRTMSIPVLFISGHLGKYVNITVFFGICLYYVVVLIKSAPLHHHLCIIRTIAFNILALIFMKMRFTAVVCMLIILCRKQLLLTMHWVKLGSFIRIRQVPLKYFYVLLRTVENAKVILVAHSAGGIVARLAVLLTNHAIPGKTLTERCPISMIVQLSSPVIRYFKIIVSFVAQF